MTIGNTDVSGNWTMDTDLDAAPAQPGGSGRPDLRGDGVHRRGGGCVTEPSVTRSVHDARQAQAGRGHRHRAGGARRGEPWGRWTKRRGSAGPSPSGSQMVRRRFKAPGDVIGLQPG